MESKIQIQVWKQLNTEILIQSRLKVPSVNEYRYHIDTDNRYNENTHIGTKQIKTNILYTNVFYRDSKTKIQNDPGLECDLT